MHTSGRTRASIQPRTSWRSPSPSRFSIGATFLFASHTDPTGRLRHRGNGNVARPYSSHADSRSTTAGVPTGAKVSARPSPYVMGPFCWIGAPVEREDFTVGGSAPV